MVADSNSEYILRGCRATPCVPLYLAWTRLLNLLDKRNALLTTLQVLWAGYIASQIASCANGFGAHTADLHKDSYYYVVGTAHNGDVVEALRACFSFQTILFIRAANDIHSSGSSPRSST